MVAPPTSLPPSTSAPSSSVGSMTFDVIMAQLHCIDAHLDTLSDELYQVNTRVGRVARQQAHLGGFMESPSPSPEAYENDDDDFGNDDDEDGDASSPSDDKMST